MHEEEIPVGLNAASGSHYCLKISIDRQMVRKLRAATLVQLFGFIMLIFMHPRSPVFWHSQD
jgi:hypothetical protein